MGITDILLKYDEQCQLYEDLLRVVAKLLKALLDAENLLPHTVQFRLKSRDSLERKLQLHGDYSCLEDMTDVVGFRVITYFSDDVDKIAAVVKREFEVDWENSEDKRTNLDPDQFGYLSLHFVVALNSPRQSLPEYKRFRSIKFEIQIRSILQHAWAEIEHDRGYKATPPIPPQFRRRFSRLAGLLELYVTS